TEASTFFTLALFFFGSSSVVTGGTSEQPPRFEDYPVKEIFRGEPKAVDLNSHPNAKKFRTLLREGSTGPPNFAGHFKVIIIGCGIPCRRVALVDSKTGSV